MSSTVQAVSDSLLAHDLVEIPHQRIASATSGALSELVGKVDQSEDGSPDQKLESAPPEDEDTEDAATSVSNDSLPDGVIEIAELTDEALCKLEGEPETCTIKEAREYRLRLRQIGPEAFCRETVYSGKVTARKLLTAFGLQPPPILAHETDDAFYRFLGLAISRVLSKRMKLPQWNYIDDAVQLIKQSRNIIVLTGAGISTSLGIPDFRSSTGIYAKLKDMMDEFGLVDPQEVFDIATFRRAPEVFFRVAAQILVTIDHCSPTHAFIAMLQNKGKLLTNYTQNIDNIEAIAGILPEKMIQCHGSFATATCTTCHDKVAGDTIIPTIKRGDIPRCKKCASTLRAPTMKRKRSANGRDKKRNRNSWSSSSDEEDYNDPDLDSSESIMKPDITFFGEPLPDHFSKRLTGHDKYKVDLVIVIGTSLKVAPVSEVVAYLPAHVPQMYISRDPVNHVDFDIDLLGDCDVVVTELCRRAGWDLVNPTIKEGTEITGKIEIRSEGSRHYFKAEKSE